MSCSGGIFCSEIELISISDELMNNLQQVKKIVQAKWNKSNGNGSNFSQEELTAEAEKILKKTQSKSLFPGENNSNGKTNCQSC